MKLSWWSTAGLSAAAAALVPALPAGACINTGTAEPCHCLERLLVRGADGSVTAPVVAPRLTDSAAAPAAAARRGVQVGSDFYTSDDGNAVGNVTIHVGDSIDWSFLNGIHTVTSVPDAPEHFDSGLMFGGGTFEHTFSTPGTYVYYCQIHSSLLDANTAVGPMVGTVTVLAAPTPEPGSLGLVATGTVGVVARRRRRSRRA